MLLQICCNTLQEGLIAQVVAKHSYDGTSFEITDMVKDLIDLVSIPDRYFDCMGGTKRIELKCCLNSFSLGFRQ